MTRSWHRSRLNDYQLGCRRREAYGYSRDEAVGKSVLMLVPEERRDEEPEILRKVSAGKVVEPYETQRRRKDGRLVDVQLSVSPIYDGSGKIIGASKISRDITAWKEAERLQAVLTGELNHRVKNVFATVIAILKQTLGRGDGAGRSGRLPGIADLYGEGA